ncbi:MAG TPA: hypothetical protein VD927_15710 [Chryseosolibacter sp.]|nr:hypothetical protein [Chryseosolibacter sp.]
MRPIKLILISTLLAALSCSCSSSNGDNNSSSVAISETSSKVRFAPFNNVEDVRQRLSAVGIGELGRWREDEMGGFISITPYHEFGDGEKLNNLACYLESQSANSIKTLKLVLNINNANKKAALSEFAEIIGKTYKALGLGPDTKIINEVKFGKELSAESETYKARTELEKSRIETWKFIFETK